MYLSMQKAEDVKNRREDIHNVHTQYMYIIHRRVLKI